MASKSGDSSLRDWFSKSKSSDGKPGWVQLGGKYAGKPCARQPGQTTKPKCGSSKMKRALSKDEEEAAFRRKNKKDPNPNRSGKAINVKTEETVREATYPSDFAKGSGVAKKKTGRPIQHDQPTSGGRRKTVDEAKGEKDACYHKVKSRYKVWLVLMLLVLLSSAVRRVLPTGEIALRKRDLLQRRLLPWKIMI